MVFFSFFFLFRNSNHPREGFVLFVIVFIEGSKKEVGSASAGEEQTKRRGCGSAGVLRGRGEVARCGPFV